MQATLDPRGDAQTFLTHFGGGGLEDDRYVIQRYVSRADGDIVPVHAYDTSPESSTPGSRGDTIPAVNEYWGAARVMSAEPRIAHNTVRQRLEGDGGFRGMTAVVGTTSFPRKRE